MTDRVTPAVHPQLAIGSNYSQIWPLLRTLDSAPKFVGHGNKETNKAKQQKKKRKKTQTLCGSTEAESKAERQKWPIAKKSLVTCNRLMGLYSAVGGRKGLANVNV